MTHKGQIIFSEARKCLDKELTGKNFIFITDKKVYGLYGDFMPESRTIVIPPGERSKTLRTIENIYGQLVELQADRHTVIVGTGGGVVCDTAGFAAATFKRGTGLILVPTTLLAQVDAAIGGKNGVDFAGYKNVIGSFLEPDRIIIDAAFITTLDLRNFRNGAAELVKTALVGDGALFDSLSKQSLRSLSVKELQFFIRSASEIKALVVKKDPFDKGIRKILNFGHTIGHALELSSKDLLHGEAVSIGMIAASRLSEIILGLEPAATKIITKVLEMNGLPVRFPDEISNERIMTSIVHDKKKNSDKIDLVLLSGIGEASIITLTFNELKGHLNDLRQHFKS
jgi:3-dehydroquinate synthase